MTSDSIRAYHFLSAERALDDLTHRRLKLSEIDKLNDPFELWCVAQTDRRLRLALRAWKTDIAQQFGMLCFCAQWHNPVLWSHYADKHRGMCLGFDLPRNKVKLINYVDTRLPLRLPLTQATADDLLYSKYRDWQYEQELRGWFSLNEKDPASGLYFYAFDDQIQLKEVIVGPLCDAAKSKITGALAGYGATVRITKARLAFSTFQVVKNRAGFKR